MSDCKGTIKFSAFSDDGDDDVYPIKYLHLTLSLEQNKNEKWSKQKSSCNVCLQTDAKVY